MEVTGWNLEWRDKDVRLIGLWLPFSRASVGVKGGDVGKVWGVLSGRSINHHSIEPPGLSRLRATNKPTQPLSGQRGARRDPE